ncbi:MAG TPA: hypothetical protein VMA75_03975 [Candidatus Paceibacterota bacterium]|nr:hypothetical protein [Candidatus Paceibacterota bacterium]
MAEEIEITPSAVGQKVKPSKKAPRSSKTKEVNKRRKRTVRPYPGNSFEDSLELALQIQKFAAGEKVRRLTLLKEMEKSPTSSSTQMLITNSAKYGITTGSYVAEWLELTPDGKIASDVSLPEKETLQAKFRLAIESVHPFKALYDEYKGKKIPSHEVIKDFLKGADDKVEDLQECIDLFIVNAKYLGLLQTIAGSEMLISIEQVVDETQNTHQPSGSTSSVVPATSIKYGPLGDTAKPADLKNVCFYIAPIGAEESDVRKHSDLFLNSIIEPALKDFNLSVVRADKIGESGIITSQILEHLLKARLVIVDLSFHNPNVFYELAVRHASKLPIVQIIRKCDRLPFDVDQVRTIEIDTTDIYSLVPKLETYRSEIATHVRQALANPDSVSNPLTVFSPGFQVIFPK